MNNTYLVAVSYVTPKGQITETEFTVTADNRLGAITSVTSFADAAGAHETLHSVEVKQEFTGDEAIAWLKAKLSA